MVSHGSVCPHDADSDNKYKLIDLLKQALDLADSEGLPSEIGARMQELIDMIECSGDDTASELQ